MKLLWDRDIRIPAVLALGCFDGVHAGHRAILDAGRRLADETGATLCACTFNVHPKAVFAPEAAPACLSTLSERARYMVQTGVNSMQILPFTRKMAEMTAEEFLTLLQRRFSPVGILCGDDFSFGRNGAGRVDLLQAWGRANGVTIVVVPEVRRGGDRVSSTRIRALLEAGDVAEANALLGRSYCLEGTVVRGKQMGRELGYPTANVQVAGTKQLPAFGVYLCRAVWAGQDHPAVVNIGRQPTLPSGRVTVEAHLTDGDYELYDKRLRLQLVSFLRPETRFPDVEALKEQLKKDKKTAADYFGSCPGRPKPF